MQTFTIHDLRNHTGDLIREAKAGRLSIVSKRGRPVFVAVPFDEYLTKDSINVAIAVKSFNDDEMTAEQAAKLARMTLPEFIACASIFEKADFGATNVDCNGQEPLRPGDASK